MLVVFGSWLLLAPLSRSNFGQLVSDSICQTSNFYLQLFAMKTNLDGTGRSSNAFLLGGDWNMNGLFSISYIPYAPWCWYIYLHLGDFWGKCRCSSSSTMGCIWVWDVILPIDEVHHFSSLTNSQTFAGLPMETAPRRLCEFRLQEG